MLGKGAFGKVWKVRRKSHSDFYAMKVSAAVRRPVPRFRSHWNSGSLTAFFSVDLDCMESASVGSSGIVDKADRRVERRVLRA